MKPLTFTLTKKLDFDLNLGQLTPDRLNGKTIKQILATRLDYGKQKATVESLFQLTGTDSDHIQFQHSCSRLTHIGNSMGRGTIQVVGNAGDYLGRKMQGGLINVTGDAGSWTATGMAGGKIEISGDCGDYLAAGSPGDVHGMNEGTVIIHGNVGFRAGERMRRGLIVVFGQADDYCANQMLAGTIIIIGKTGAYLGFGMKRGTIILAKKPRHVLATFRQCGLLKIEFLRLLFKQLALSCKTFDVFKRFGPEAIRYAGDASVGGQGEILVLQNARLPK